MFNFTENQKAWLGWTVIVLLIGIAGFLGVQFPVQVPPTPAPVSGEIGAQALASQGIKCTSGSPATGDCVTIWNGGRLSLYSDTGTTRKFYVDGSGNVTAAGTYALGNGTASAPALTFASDLDTGLYRVGANQLGVTVGGSKIIDCNTVTCTFQLPSVIPGVTSSTGVTVTGVITLSQGGTITANGSVTGVGVVSTNGFTGTVMTANQPNITNLGTQTYFTATNATVTNGTATYLQVTNPLTATLATANQPNVTNLGTQAYLTATNFALAGITQKWSVGGTEATYTTGASIAFTTPTTPTWCIISGEEITATKTITSAGFSSNTAPRTNPTYWTCGQ